MFLFLFFKTIATSLPPSDLDRHLGKVRPTLVFLSLVACGVDDEDEQIFVGA